MNKSESTKVYVPNLGTHDYSDAERYGDLVYVTKGNVHRYAVPAMVRAWVKSLQDSKPDDYIMVTSMSHLCLVGGALFALKHEGKVNLLLFRNGKYFARELMLSQALEAEEEVEDA